ncbi:MAG TPA: proton-conducting transporter membrane subunit [Telluria sp.]
MTDPLAWLILLPLLWASAAFLAGPGRGARLAIAALALQLVLAMLAAREALDGSRGHAAGGWAAPLGIELAADGLAATMLLLTQAVVLTLAVYARAWFAVHPEGSQGFWPLAGFLVAAMNALFLSADIFNLYVTLELLGLAAVGLVATGGNAAALTAALRYLFVSLAASGAYLLGVALVYGAYGAVSLRILAPLLAAGPADAAVLGAGLMTAGLLFKTALFPFHGWLPPAHGGAPAPVSALLSALVVKATFYLLLRLWTGVGAPLALPPAGLVLGLLGAAAIGWGSVMALRQERLKMLVAYSTVAQVGYLFLVFPLMDRADPDRVAAASGAVVLQAVAHALAKAAMFAAAGAVAISAGHDVVARLGGLAAQRPVTLFAFGLAGVTLMGLPPSAGFISKWLLLEVALAAGWWELAAVILAGGLLTAAYVFRVLRHAFGHAAPGVAYLPLARTLEWPALVLALASIVLGMQPAPLLALAGVR